MDNIVPTLYKEYGEYVNFSRQFPLINDGLKPVERRILLSSYKIAKDKLVKSARIDGHVIGNYHPHASVYSSIVQLVRQGFLEGQGNFGCNVGVEPEPAAASRYTECRLALFTNRIAFKYINHVDWEINDLGEKEPKFLPTMLPFCLMGKEFTQGIGFGYRSYIPCYKPEDLYKRLLWLLEISKRKPTIKPITDCTIEASHSDLEKLLTEGKSTIDISGVIKEDPIHNIVSLLSWPPGKRFESLLNKFSEEITRQDIGFTDLSVTETRIQFEVIKQRNRDKIYENLVKKLKESIKGRISFENILVNENQKVELVSVDKMLLTSFDTFSKTCARMLKFELNLRIIKIDSLNLLEKIRPAIIEVAKSTNFSVDEMVDKISTLSKVDVDKVKELISRNSINKLLSLKIDITETVNQKKAIEEKIKNIKQFVLDQYKEI